ncbi:MAG: hypothetical protein WC485_00100 [Opitutaceae bacterium]
MFYLSEKDQHELQRLVKSYRAGEFNPQQPETPQQETVTPDIYVAKLQDGQTLDGAAGGVPSRAKADVYKIVPDETGAATLIQAGTDRDVYNISANAIQPDTWFQINRDKFGRWLVATGSASVSFFKVLDDMEAQAGNPMYLPMGRANPVAMVDGRWVDSFDGEVTVGTTVIIVDVSTMSPCWRGDIVIAEEETRFAGTPPTGDITFYELPLDGMQIILDDGGHIPSTIFEFDDNELGVANGQLLANGNIKVALPDIADPTPLATIVNSFIYAVDLDLNLFIYAELGAVNTVHLINLVYGPWGNKPIVSSCEDRVLVSGMAGGEAGIEDPLGLAPSTGQRKFCRLTSRMSQQLRFPGVLGGPMCGDLIEYCGPECQYVIGAVPPISTVYTDTIGWDEENEELVFPVMEESRKHAILNYLIPASTSPQCIPTGTKFLATHWSNLAQWYGNHAGCR